MRRLATAVALLLLITPLSAPAQTAAKKETIEELVKALAEAFTSKSLGSLAAERPQQRGVRVVVEHSISGRRLVRSFRTLELADRWLNSQDREDGPARTLMPLHGCSRNVCVYDLSAGILHNNLYLKRVAYGYRNGRPYIKTIYLLDGD